MLKDTDKLGAISVSEFKQEMRAQNAIFANPGIEMDITTTTQIMGRVLESNYYELNGQKLSDFVPIEVGTGAFSTKLLQAAATATGTDFKSCLINPTAGALKLDGYTDIEVGNMEYPNNFFRDTYSITKEGAEIASRAKIPFNVVEQKEKARKKKFDLGLQEAWFLGLDDDVSYGLLNQPAAITDTSTLGGKNLSQMTDDEFSSFIATIRAYYDNVTSSTAMFNRLMLPQQEYFKLDKVFGQFGLSRRSILDDVLKETGGKIVYTRYNTTAGTGGGARYALYKHDPDYIEGFLPLPYTPSPLYAQGAFDMISNAMAQFVTPQLKRQNTLVYLDVVS